MRARLVSAAVLAAAVTVSVFAAPAVATHATKSNGNSGTIKVAEVDDVGTSGDSSHVKCTFALEWYNYGPRLTSEVEFESIKPTEDAGMKVVSGRKVVKLDNDAAKGPNDLDGREIYTLSFTGEPQKNQGFHVKVKTATISSKGEDSKTKTFWTGPCEEPADPEVTDPAEPEVPEVTDPEVPEVPEVTDPEVTDPEVPEVPEVPEAPFSWDWTYAAPTCSALTVAYPSNIPDGQANDVNVRFETNQGQFTLNFHNNTGTWTGTTAFDFASHRNWPAGVTAYRVTWVQVGGTNYHWQGNVACPAA